MSWPFPSSGALALAGFVTLVLVALAYRALRRGGAHGWVDVAWALGTLGASLVFLWDDGLTSRDVLLLGLLALWGGRLSWHLARRCRSAPQDPRYERLVQAMGPKAAWALPLWYLLQAVIALGLGLSVAASAARPQALDGQDLAGATLTLIALVLEGLADRQLAAHRRDPGARATVLDRGLWAWSRHPNYFGEWLFWVGLSVVGFQLSQALPVLLGPALMSAFLFRLTGIPHAEAQALARRGEAYRAYQRRTSIFFPWPPSRSRS